jgi:hypothetical protein
MLGGSMRIKALLCTRLTMNERMTEREEGHAENNGTTCCRGM